VIGCMNTFSAYVNSSMSLIVSVCSKSTESEERRCARRVGMFTSTVEDERRLWLSYIDSSGSSECM
jgi:hypothetical protein